jgi:hypothetical protein
MQKLRQKDTGKGNISIALDRENRFVFFRRRGLIFGPIRV